MKIKLFEKHSEIPELDTYLSLTDINYEPTQSEYDKIASIERNAEKLGLLDKLINAASIRNWGRDNRITNMDKLKWREKWIKDTKNRITKGGKLNKNSAVWLKNQIKQNIGESLSNPKVKTGEKLADMVLGWYDFDADYIDDGSQRRRVINTNNNVVEWFGEHPTEIKQKAYSIMKSKVHSSDKTKLEREFGKKVNENINEGIVTIALGVAGGLLLLKLLAKVLKFTIGRVGQHVTLSKDDLLKIKEQVINEAMKTVISNGRGDLSIPIVKLGKYIEDEINSGRITKAIHIVNLFKKLKDGEIKIKESKNLKEAVSADQIRQSMSGFVGPKFAKKASDEDIMKMVALKDKIAKIHNSEILPIQKQIDTLYKQYKIKSTKGIEESVNEGKKAFKVNPQIGKSKYSISYHDGNSKHKDGSDFWGIKIFKNKEELIKGINDFKSQGFIYER